MQLIRVFEPDRRRLLSALAAILGDDAREWDGDNATDGPSGVNTQNTQNTTGPSTAEKAQG